MAPAGHNRQEGRRQREGVRLPAVAVILAMAAIAGCLDGGADCPPQATFATPAVEGKYMQTDPTQAWQTVVLSPPDGAARTTELAWGAAKGWTAYGTPLSAPGTGLLQVGTVLPGDGEGNATMRYAVRGPDASCAAQAGSLEWDLAAPKEGGMALPGQGVHVMTAGFFENGTLFYTNIAEVDADPSWPKVSWYAWEGDAPLPVYVYDRDRSEQPPEWKGSNALWAQAHGQTGPTPIDPQVDEATAGADGEHGLGYFTTIPGFNDALKGLSTTTTRVARLAPEQAYTRPGNEEHPLYGAAIVFYIKVLDVVSAPCPAGTPPMLCQAGLPTVPPAH